MCLAFDPRDILDGLEVTDWGLGEVLTLGHRVVSEGLRLLRLVLTLIKLSVL